MCIRDSVRTNLLALSLVITTLGLELHTTKGHDSSSQHVAIPLLLLSKAKNIEGILSVLQLLVVINGVNFGLALAYVDVVIDVSTEATLGPQTLTNTISIWLDQLVEDMVRPLNSLLLGDTRLLKKIGDNVATTELARAGEVNPDELTKPGGVVVPGGFGIAIGLKLSLIHI